MDDVLQQPQFAWRLPKDDLDIHANEEPQGLLHQLLAPLVEFFSNIGSGLGHMAKASMDWLSKHLGFLASLLGKLFSHETEQEAPESFDFADISKPLVLLLLAGLCGILIFLLIKTLKKRKKVTNLQTEELQIIPNLHDEETTADQLPEEQWLRLAREMLEKKEMRLALRALYLANFAHLEERHFIVIKPFKSNRDYLRELGRSSHETGDLMPLFSKSITLFEQVWYGNHLLDGAGITRFENNSAQMRSCCDK